MSIAAETLPAPAPSRLRNVIRMHAAEIRFELIKLIRLPAYLVPTLAFPVIFYAFFGLAFGHGKVTGSTTMATYLVATYGAFGVIGASLFGIGSAIAIERGQGWLLVKRATPMPMSAFLLAKIAMAVIFSMVILVSLFTLGAAFGGVRFPLETWFTLFVALVTGALPFCALGLTIGYFAGPNSAPAIVNMLFIPMSFLSGLWIPINFLPKLIQNVALVLPPYHLSWIALHIIGAASPGPLWPHVLVLGPYTLMFLTLTAIGYARDEGKTYG